MLLMTLIDCGINISAVLSLCTNSGLYFSRQSPFYPLTYCYIQSIRNEHSNWLSPMILLSYHTAVILSQSPSLHFPSPPDYRALCSMTRPATPEDTESPRDPGNR